VKTLQTKDGNARAFWRAPESPRVSLAWLGQAGFAIRQGSLRLVIDPYLSDCLEKKYRGTEKPHNRMMPAPITPEELTGLDFVLCTHRHSDHMDPEALPQIAATQPQTRFVVPRAEQDHARNLGLPAARLIPADATDVLTLAPHCSLRVIASAHESMEKNERGEHRYLGYILRFEDVTIYHSGDTVPYAELAQTLAGESIDLALLPVNGRGRGVAGNFTFSEAVSLCRAAGIPRLIPHHFGMFAFNTVDRKDVVQWADETSHPTCFLPQVDSWFEFNLLGRIL